MKLLQLLFVAWSAAVLPPGALGADLPSVSVEHMLPGYCFAGGRLDDRAPGGFGRSANLPEPLAGRFHGVAPDRLGLVAVPEEEAAFAGKYRGFTLLLINRTGGEIAFSASDSRLSIVMQAQDETGRWREIEHLPSSWCGNSRHRVFLPAKHRWKFTAPVYAGSQPVMLRFALARGQEPPLVSNEFPGAINPAQFTEKQGHIPTDIMDPYGN